MRRKWEKQSKLLRFAGCDCGIWFLKVFHIYQFRIVFLLISVTIYSQIVFFSILIIFYIVDQFWRHQNFKRTHMESCRNKKTKTKTKKVLSKTEYVLHLDDRFAQIHEVVTWNGFQELTTRHILVCLTRFCLLHNSMCSVLLIYNKEKREGTHNLDYSHIS